MKDRTELIEAALDCLPHGIGLIDSEDHVVFWNRAAEAITGHPGAGLLGRMVHHALDELVVGGARQWTSQTNAESSPGRGSLVHLRHRLGHSVPAMVRVMVLRSQFGDRIGTEVVFHPAETIDALPRGECGEGSTIEKSQADIEERIEEEFEDFKRDGPPLGVLWVNVDQAHELRKTHGVRACEAMLEKIERALENGLRPTEEMGRWGDDEFLVLSHERTPEMLAEHAQRLAGLARTADFRWWGDRLSLTVSIGAAQADPAETVGKLLERAQAAMVSSIHEGGNHIALAPEGKSCLPS